MSIRSERIKSLIEQSNKTYQELEKITGVKKSSLQRYASGVTSKIPLDVIEKLSNSFNVSQEYLMGWDDQKNISTNELPLTDEDKEFLQLLHKLPTESRQMLKEFFVLFDKLPLESQPMVVEMIRVAAKNLQ